MQFIQSINTIYGENLLEFADPELSGVLPHNAGCSRCLDFIKMRSFHHQLKIKRCAIKSNVLTNDLPSNESFNESSQKQSSVFHSPKTPNTFSPNSSTLIANRTSSELSPHKPLIPKIRYNPGFFMKFFKASSIGVISPVKNNSKVSDRRKRDYYALNDLENEMYYPAVKLCKSSIHGWGLFAAESIVADNFIIEYCGEKIRSSVADIRERKYETDRGPDGLAFNYLFRIDNDYVIDATKKGNFARFINHSCTPNCVVKRKNVGGEYKLIAFSKRFIYKGEELTYDYKFSRESADKKMECFCRSEGCRIWLN